ncbi:MAG: glycosyltransferase family 39 protein [Candidatus Helarchaeota archaeon]
MEIDWLKSSWSLRFFLLGFLFNFAISFFFPFKRDDFTFWIPLTATTIFLGNEILNSVVFGLLSFLKLLPHRPLALWTYHYLLRIFGSNAWGFHLFKALFVGLSSVLIYQLKDNKSKTFFFIFNGIVWASTIWICDWEIVSQFFFISSIYCFEKRKEHKIYYVLIIIAVVLGNLYKDSSKAIPVVIFLYILIKLMDEKNFEKNEILEYLVIFLATSIPVGIIFLTIQSIEISINPFNLVIFTLLTFAIGNEMLIRALIDKKEDEEGYRYLKKNLLYLVWLITVLSLSVLISAVEFRHLLPIVVPLTLFMQINDEKFPSKKYIGYLIGIAITWVLGILQVQYLLAGSII